MTATIKVTQGGESSAPVKDYTAQIPFWEVDGGRVPRWQLGNAGGEFIVDDDAGAIPDDSDLTHLSAHNVVTATEDASGTEYWIARGRILTKSIGRNENNPAGDARQFTVQVNGVSAEVAGLVVTEDWARDAETDYERLVALQAYILNGSSSTASVGARLTTTITVDDTHLAPNTNTVSMPAKTYPAGTTVTEIIQDCADTAGKIWFPVIDHTGGSHVCLLYILENDHTTYACTASISDVRAEIAPDASPPVYPPSWDQGAASLEDGAELPTGLVLRYGSGDSFVVKEVTAANGKNIYDVWFDTYYDDVSVTAAQATAKAQAILDYRRLEHVTHQVTLYNVKASDLHLIEAGMSIDIKSAAAMGGQYLGTTQTRRISECSKEPWTPEVGAVEATYRVNLSLDRVVKASPYRTGNKATTTAPKPPSPATAASCSLADEQMTAISTPNGDANSGTTNWTGVGTASATPNSIGPSGNPYFQQIYAGGNTAEYTGWTGLTFTSGTVYAVKFWGYGTSTHTITFGLQGTDVATLSLTATQFNGWKEWCFTWTPSADRTGVTIRFVRSSTGSTQIDDLRAFTGTSAQVPTLGGPGEGDPGTSGSYTPPDAVIEHGDLSDKGGTMHDASQIEFTPTGTIAATNVQDAIAEVASEAGSGTAGHGLYLATTYGAVEDGATDDTSAIQDAIDAASTAGGGTVLVAGHSLVSFGSNRYCLTLPTGVSLIGLDPLSSIIELDTGSTVPAGTVFHIIEIGSATTGANNVQVRDLYVKAHHSTKGGGGKYIQGIAARHDTTTSSHSDHVTIDNCRVEDANIGIGCAKDGSTSGSARTGSRHKRWSVRNCYVDTTTNKAIELQEAEDSEIVDNFILNAEDGAQTINYSTRIIIARNSISYAEQGIGVTEGCSDVLVEDNLIVENGNGTGTTGSAGIHLRREPYTGAVTASRIKVLNNTVIDTASTNKIGFAFETRTENTGTSTYEDVEIRGNTFNAANNYLYDKGSATRSQATGLRVFDNYFIGSVLTDASWVSSDTRFERNRVTSAHTANNDGWWYEDNDFDSTFTIVGSITQGPTSIGGVEVSGTASSGKVIKASSATAASWQDEAGTVTAADVRDAGHWEIIVSGSAPPVAATNEAEDDFVFGWISG